MSSDTGKPLSAFRVIAAGIAWRLLGSRGAGALLLQAMQGEDEQNRMLAGMSLVKAGDRSLRLIAQEIKDGKGTVTLIRLLPDIAGEDARDVLKVIVDRDSGDTAEAASECIDLLDRMKLL